MPDLFDTVDDLTPIPLPEGDVSYAPQLRLPQSNAFYFDHLNDTVPWRQEDITLWGKTYPQPRLIAWYGDEGCAYRYSGLDLTPHPWTEVLAELKQAVEAAAQSAFNSVLVNLYRDHRDSMGMHSDDEPELGPAPTIASLSFGETRTLTFKHKARVHASKRLDLADGSLLLMKGETQQHWKHGIAKRTRVCGPRLNLTFRKIVPPHG